MEFLRTGDGELFFIEVNARLQVEHPVTEMCTGLDLVEQQLRLAANERLTLAQKDVVFDGHAIECRINAEDPAQGFAPSPGCVTAFQVPAEADQALVRLESYLKPGVTIPIYYDSLAAKVITHAKTRDEARCAMLQVLANTHIEGIATTVPFLLQVLADARFQHGNYDTSLVAALRG
jgi:acetyl-CoA carboxylase biotin carboxylase subunit